MTQVSSGSKGPVARLLSEGVQREPMTDHGGRSGSTFERAVLPDGTRIVLKHISSQHDWIMRATKDEGRAACLCLPGVLDRVSHAIDLAVLGVEQEADGWVIAMRDVRDALIPTAGRVSRADSLRVLRAAGEIHAAFWGEQVDGLVRLADRYTLFSPWFGHQIGIGAANSKRGWEIFSATGPADIVRAITAIAKDPESLCSELDCCEKTLIHGDLKLDNVGLAPDRVILLDWALAGIGPPEVDYAWFLMMNAGRIDASLDNLLDDIRAALGIRFNPQALELALTGVFVQWGPFLAQYASGERPDRDPDQAQKQLDWWLRRVSRSLEAWSPV